MKVLVTGVGGQLGHDVMNELARRGHQGVGSDIAPVYSGIADGSAVTGMPYVAMDITNEQQVRQVMDQVRPDAVIHCAAWTAVDLAEDADKQPKVRAINVDGTAHLAAGVQGPGLQDDVHFHGLCVQWAGPDALAAGLQGLSAPEFLRRDQAGRRAGRQLPAGEVFHRADRLGVRPERQELHQDHAPAGQDPRQAAGGVRPDRHAHLYPGPGPGCWRI